MSRLFSLVEHIQLNLAFSHLLKEQSAASKWFHFSFASPPPHSQMPVWWLVCFSKKHWISHWNTYSWKRSQGSTIFSSSPRFFSDLPSPSSLFTFLQIPQDSILTSLCFIHSFGHKGIKRLLSAYHVSDTMLQTSKHQWIRQKSPPSWNFTIYYEK